MGFSSHRCLPALSAAMPSSKCVLTGVAMAIASISGSLSRSWKLVVVLTAGKRFLTSSSLRGSRSDTAATVAWDNSAKLRTRLGPQ
jgi:hypothetical protein